MKGYRTLAVNTLTVIGGTAAAVLLYVGDLGLTDEQTAAWALGATIASGVVNFFMRLITTTPVGEKQ